MKKIWVQIFAILALIGILLGIVGTAWLYGTPSTPVATPVAPTTVTQ